MTGKGGGRRSRGKGAAGERELAAELTRVFGIEARRGRQYSGGPGTPDVISGLPDIHIEVKRCEKLSLYPAMDQSAEDSSEADIPIVAHRRNNKPWLAIIRLDDLPEFIARMHLVTKELKGGE